MLFCFCINHELVHVSISSLVEGRLLKMGVSTLKRCGSFLQRDQNIEATLWKKPSWVAASTPLTNYDPLCRYHFHFWHQSVCETFSTNRHSFALFTWIIKGHCGIMRSSTCEFDSAKTSGRHQFREESIIMQWNQNSRTSWPIKLNQYISGLLSCIHTRNPFSNLLR